MTTLEDCFDGLRDAVESVTGVTAYHTGDEAVSAPAVVMAIETADPHFDSGGMLEASWSCAVLVPRNHPDQFKVLLGLCEPSSPASIVAAINADETLGGRVSDCVVTSIGQLGSISYLGQEFYGGVIAGEILGTSDG